MFSYRQFEARFLFLVNIFRGQRLHGDNFGLLAAEYRLTVDTQAAVTQVTILKGFTVTAIYDERFSNVKGNAVPALDKVMVQALMRWRAKPGQSRVVDIYSSFGTRPWLNYGKPNVSQ
ncbi:MAG: hypothetical protein DME59_16200 [Verrucomicrobia bacterium]|nr:MAG: hypothetical protein DME59_16200 [Verrucomicrobiota bacterium]